MKNSIRLLSLFLFLMPFQSFAQTHQDSTTSILNTSEDWLSEILPLPLSFAPSLNYTGFEDLRFAKDWSKKDHEHFWTYTFVWVLDKDPKLNETKLEADIKAYYDGLMEVENSVAKFEKKDDQLESNFQGHVQTHDRFFTKEDITLNIKVYFSFCQALNKYLVRFDISPKAIGDEVWAKFKEIYISANCEY